MHYWRYWARTSATISCRRDGPADAALPGPPVMAPMPPSVAETVAGYVELARKFTPQGLTALSPIARLPVQPVPTPKSIRPRRQLIQ
jgi:hypothetical protein